MIKAVLARLDAVKKQNGGYVCKCPAHDDKIRSLSVKEGDKGIVFRCHAGCAFTDIAAALDFKPSDLFYDRATETAPNKQKVVATYDYVNGEGEPLYQVVRLDPKGFRQRRKENNGWVWSLGDTDRVLYNLPKVKEQMEAGGYIFIVEGEKDVDRLATEGFTATTNAGGATQWLDSYTKTLAGAKELVILPDNDQAGKKHAYTIQASLKALDTESKIIELPGLAEKGDISDWFDHGGTAEALRKLVQSDFVRPADMVNLTDALGFVEKYTAEPLPKGLSWPWDRVTKLTRGVRGGWLCYLAGRPAHGKTAAAIEMATHTAQQGKRVLFVSLEMSCEELAVRVTQAWGLDTWRFYSGNPHESDREAVGIALAAPWNGNIEIAYSKKLQRIEELIAVCEPELLIVDYLQLVEIGSHTRTEGTTRVSHSLKDIARRFNIPVVPLSQLRRAQPGEKHKPPTLHDLKDSGSLEQDADQVIFVHREVDDKNNPEPEGSFIVAKARMGITGSASFTFDGGLQKFSCVTDAVTFTHK